MLELFVKIVLQNFLLIFYKNKYLIMNKYHARTFCEDYFEKFPVVKSLVVNAGSFAIFFVKLRKNTN